MQWSSWQTNSVKTYLYYYGTYLWFMNCGAHAISVGKEEDDKKKTWEKKITISWFPRKTAANRTMTGRK
jgi:hypothetical protein